MANGSLSGVVRQVERLFHQGTATGLAEGQLLERFIARGDDVAFEAIVARHGPTVLRVCRQLLSDPNDVDDAFQATFLVLVRKAGAIHQQDALGGWLYGVAHRVAVRARHQASRSPRFGCQVAQVDDPCRLERSELREAIHEEVSRLPEKYRVPIILCYLEGLSHVEAAERLRWPVGTVRGRMARGRDLLRSRLTRRGVTLSTAAIGWFMASEGRSASVPRSLAESTLRGASRCAHKSSLAGTVSAQAIALTDGVLTAMLWNKLKLAAVALTASFVITAGVGVFAQQGPATKPAPENKRRLAQAPAEKGQPGQTTTTPAARSDGERTKTVEVADPSQAGRSDPRNAAKADEPTRREQMATELSEQQAQVELLEIEVESGKEELRELRKLFRTKDLDMDRPLVNIAARDREILEKQRGADLDRLAERLRDREKRFVVQLQDLAKLKRDAEQLEAGLRERATLGVAQAKSGRVSSRASETGDTGEGGLLTQIEEDRLDLELLKLTVESEHSSLLQAHRTLNQIESGATGLGYGGGPGQPSKEEIEKARQERLRTQSERVETLRKKYLTDKVRLSKAEQELAHLEAKAGTRVRTAETKSETADRLEAVEKKLDRLIEAIDKSKK